MPSERQVDRAFGELGELISSHGATADLSEYEPYRADPVGFSREVVGDTDPGPWSVQRRVMEDVRDHDRVAWRSGQGVGKGWTISRLALWWAYAVQGQVLLQGPTSRTVHETLMRKEVARAHRKAGLPGKLYVNALRIRDEEASILAFTTSSPSGGTGHHGRILAILDEAQGVDAGSWEATFANVTGQDDKLFACGNPLHPTGPFFEVSRPDSGWRTVQTSSTDHPNLTDEPTYIPGGPSEEWLERMRDRWGEESPMWQARVLGEFPLDSVQGLFSYAEVEAAMERGQEAEVPNAEPVVAVDVARHGLDSSVACIRRGPVVEELVTWSGASTTETVEKVEEVAFEAGVRKDQLSELPTKMRRWARKEGAGVAYGEIRVDEIGIGAGVVDQLKDQGWPVKGFKSSRRAHASSRFASRRCEAHWALKEMLEAGDIALPDDERLREEMLAVEWSPDSKGRVRIEGKDAISKRIGRSPDRLDALVMALVDQSGPRPPKKRIVKF